MKTIGGVAETIWNNIRTIERLIILAAAIAAIFPLLQWYSEADDRRLERVASLITAADSCTTLSNDALFQIYLDGKMFMGARRPTPRQMPAGAYDPGRAAKMLCAEIAFYLISDEVYYSLSTGQ